MICCEQAILYVRDNEQTQWVRIVHCAEFEKDGAARTLLLLLSVIARCVFAAAAGDRELSAGLRALLPGSMS